ncbi:MAG: hypothetical protein OES69_02370 [Myxococcales bacterium]|nr:hypothetical protein [Myxococcales bacterium]
MTNRREQEFGIITKLGGNQVVLKMLEAMGEDHAISLRAINHWYHPQRRKISGSAAMSLRLAAASLGIKEEYGDFVLDPPNLPEINKAIAKALA